MVDYQRIPTAVKYVWTSVDQSVARGAAPSWYHSKDVTPYLIHTSDVPSAWLLEPGAVIDVNPALSVHKLYNAAFVPRGYKWVKIPPNVTGNTIGELCANLMASDPFGSTFPALYYDLGTPNKTWPGGVPIWRLLVDYWENREYRFAQVQAKGQDMWTNLSPKLETAIGGKRLEWVLARDATVDVLHPATGGTTVVRLIPPPLSPPKMKVGLNHSWAFNQYGSSFGPHDNWIERWFDQLPENLRIAKRRWGIEHVRMFILCNGYNYGEAVDSSWGGPIVMNPGSEAPVIRARNAWRFDPPPKLHQKFLDDFARVLQAFKATGCKLIPSLLDFGAFAPTQYGGKRDIVADPVKRKVFLDTVLEKFLDVSMSFKDQNLRLGGDERAVLDHPIVRQTDCERQI
ncbi:MAG: hypothetical protein QM820_22660 [Minicystis sp.]